MAGSSRTYIGAVALLLAMAGTTLPARAQDGEQRLLEMEQRIRELTEEVQTLRTEQAEQAEQQEDYRRELEGLAIEATDDEGSGWLDEDHWVRRFELGGYGEIHGNFGEGEGNDFSDIHRLVLYAGYDFADWIQLSSEIEIEHAFVNDDNGEAVIEQLFVDFLASPWLNFRAGRVLTPLGIVNQKHEPTTFYGVERPAFAKYIIPTTWSQEGVGVWGSPTPALKYQLYVTNSLDGSGFDAIDGIRGGRMKERPGQNEPAVSGRVDFFPLLGQETRYDQDLRIGVSGYFGGLDNANKGADPDVNGEISIASADFDYSIDRWDFRGVIAYESIDDAASLGNGVAEGIFGWYLQAAYHWWPEQWRTGRFSESDAVVFARYDSIDTQHDMPSGVDADPAGDRSEWTLGSNFYFTPNLVFKADYQCRTSDAESDLDHRINVGLGWQF